MHSTTIGANANEYGFYSLTLPKGKQAILAQYFGYVAQMEEIDFSINTTINFELKEDTKLLEEVV